MKKLLLPLFLILCCFHYSKAQTVRIVDNNSNPPTGPNIYSTIQEAVDAAVDGDFIYIQPSPTTYGSATIDKELHLVGIGFDLTKDFPLNSSINDLVLTNNIDNTSDADNSSITGLIIDEIRLLQRSGAPNFELDNVKIYNNQIFRLWSACCGNYITASNNLEIYGNRITNILRFSSPANNIIIRNNLLQTNTEFESTAGNSGIISNNIIYGFIAKRSSGDLFTIQNNNFVGAKGNSFSFDELLDVTVANNIFYGRTPSDRSGGNSNDNNFQRNVFTNNLSYETGNDALPPLGGGVGNTGSGNIVGLSPLFGNVQLLNTWSETYNFSLGASSPALNAGSDGTDIGITGGPYPFSEQNFTLDPTALPTIEILNTSSVINPGDDLDVRIKAKSN